MQKHIHALQLHQNLWFWGIGWKCSNTQLTVLECNNPAVRCYEKAGFERKGEWEAIWGQKFSASNWLVYRKVHKHHTKACRKWVSAITMELRFFRKEEHDREITLSHFSDFKVFEFHFATDLKSMAWKRICQHAFLTWLIKNGTCSTAIQIGSGCLKNPVQVAIFWYEPWDVLCKAPPHKHHDQCVALKCLLCCSNRSASKHTQLLKWDERLMSKGHFCMSRWDSRHCDRGGAPAGSCHSRDILGS